MTDELIGSRVVHRGHYGTIVARTGHWHHIDWDDWKTKQCNYWGVWEFKVVEEGVGGVSR